MRSTPEQLDTDAHLAMRSIIERIATGRELSRDIAQAEARPGGCCSLHDAADHARLTPDSGRTAARTR
ncbi:MAG: hypothetical protein MUF57_03030 [Gammaproteobacteria bacterium]|jgi:hypothetical protein|nr:hypothetical protein [Gammaproteobacteria bacterium]